MAAFSEALASAGSLYAQIPFPLLVLGHSLTVCAFFKGAHGDRYLLNFFVSFIGGFGGGILSALLMQAPDKASIAILSNHAVGLWWPLGWWALNYCPGDLVGKLLALLPVKAAAKVGLNILRAALIVHRVNAAVAVFPGVVAAPLLLGTVGGAGGKVISDALNVAIGASKGPSELAQPGFSLWSAFLCSLLNYVLVHVARALSVEEGLALVTTLLVVQGLTNDLTGQHTDFTQPFARLFHAVTLIPMPGQPHGKGRSARGKAAVSNPATPTPSATKQVAKQLDDEVGSENATNGKKAAHKEAVHKDNGNGVSGRVTRRRRAAAEVNGLQ